MNKPGTINRGQTGRSPIFRRQKPGNVPSVPGLFPRFPFRISRGQRCKASKLYEFASGTTVVKVLITVLSSGPYNRRRVGNSAERDVASVVCGNTKCTSSELHRTRTRALYLPSRRTARGRAFTFGGFRPFHEFSDNRKNPEDHVQIREADRDGHEGRNPLGGPGNKQNQRITRGQTGRSPIFRRQKPGNVPSVPEFVLILGDSVVRSS
jgi:hypothetical protein